MMIEERSIYVVEQPVAIGLKQESYDSGGSWRKPRERRWYTTMINDWESEALSHSIPAHFALRGDRV